LLKPRPVTVEGVRDENAGADNAEQRGDGFQHGNDPLAQRAGPNRTGQYTVKRIVCIGKNGNPTDALEQQRTTAPPLKSLAIPAGFEPATHGVEICCDTNDAKGLAPACCNRVANANSSALFSIARGHDASSAGLEHVDTD
jgi:hypothetical protein